MAATHAKFKFPRIKKVTLKRFSLYSLEPNIEIELLNGVFCLAGANGLGKSTFLAAVNYGITGIVTEPDYKFLDVDEYYSDNLIFSERFFRGRISEIDSEMAEISVEMSVENYLYRITRGMFEPTALRQFEIYLIQKNKTLIHVNDTSELTPKDRHDKYIESITKHVGLDSFQQFVFLQHLILTFDESRRLVFWDDRVLERSLYLAFSVDPKEDKQAERLKREAEKADSQARNAKYAATRIRNNLKELKKQIEAEQENTDNLDDLLNRYTDLNKTKDKAQSLVYQFENELRDTRLRIAEISAHQTTLRSEYTDLFSRRAHQQPILVHHPLIVSSITDHKCGLCGAEGETVVKEIEERAQSHTCPLCGSKLQEQKPDPELLERLQEIDKVLVKTKRDLDESSRAEKRISAELEETRGKLANVQRSLEVFERENSQFLAQLNSASMNGFDVLLSKYQAQIEEFEDEARRHRRERDEKRRRLRELEVGLQKRYDAAEGDFVPKFRRLAEKFLGLDLDIRMERKSGLAPGITLVLEIESKIRRQHHQLSESQRFFVDIALRMALAQYMSDERDKAALFIDTPEGSLDIAYESRAGEMFADFVNDGYHIVMSANINSSQLLQRLAKKCGQAKMELCRMTTWTELSEVQIEEEVLFDQAYDVIENALHSKELA